MRLFSTRSPSLIAARVRVIATPSTVALPMACLLALLPGAVAAAAADYTLDSVHTRVAVSVSHAGFNSAIGTVSGSTGRISFDPDDWSTAQIDIRVPMTRLDLGDPKWNHAALAGNLLDSRAYPVATFVSTRVEPIDKQHAAVYGTLTLHGVEQEVKLDVTFNAAKRFPLPPFRRTVGFSATTTLSRKAFGITAWPSVIGDQVDLRIEAEADTRRAGESDPGDVAPADASPGASADTDANGQAGTQSATHTTTPTNAPTNPPATQDKDATP